MACETMPREAVVYAKTGGRNTTLSENVRLHRPDSDYDVQANGQVWPYG